MREKVVENVKVTPQEVKEYFDQIPKDSLPFLESEVEIGQIVVYPKASREFEKLAQDELKEYKQEVESGQAKFETLASLYSDDPAVKQNNGQYTINRNEKVMDPAFIANAFRLKEGQISPVFKTKFGYHIIQMVSRAGDDAIVRHILRIPRITETQVKEAEDKLDSIRAKLITGALSFGEAASKYSEDENQKFTAGLLQNPNGGTYLTIDMLDKDLVLSLRGMKVGEYSEPVVYTDDRQRKAVRIIYLKSRTQPHRENMKDDYDRLAQQALEIKKQQTLEKWFASKVPSYYIMIDPSFANCADLGQWWQYASKGSQ